MASGCEQAGKDLGVNVEIMGASSETAYDEQLAMIETVLAAGDADAMMAPSCFTGQPISRLSSVHWVLCPCMFFRYCLR